MTHGLSKGGEVQAGRAAAVTAALPVAVVWPAPSHRGKARQRAASLLIDSGEREFEERNDRRPNPVGLHRRSFGADAGIG